VPLPRKRLLYLHLPSFLLPRLRRPPHPRRPVLVVAPPRPHPLGRQPAAVARLAAESHKSPGRHA